MVEALDLYGDYLKATLEWNAKNKPIAYKLKKFSDWLATEI